MNDFTTYLLEENCPIYFSTSEGTLEGQIIAVSAQLFAKCKQPKKDEDEKEEKEEKEENKKEKELNVEDKLRKLWSKTITDKKRLDKMIRKSKQEYRKNTLFESSLKEMKKMFEDQKILFEGKFKNMSEEMKNMKSEMEGMKNKILELEGLKEKNKKLEEELEKLSPCKLLSEEQYLELKKVCDFGRNWKLLYKGSTDGFEASTFHTKCDNINGTLTIALTEHGNILGGFNPLKWNQAQGYCKSPGSWIFGFIDEKKKIVKIDSIENHAHGIYCNNGYGPTFGSDHCVHISNNCNSNTSSYTSVNGNGYSDGGRGVYFLNGGTRQFKVLDYEVYSK